MAQVLIHEVTAEWTWPVTISGFIRPFGRAPVLHPSAPTGATPPMQPPWVSLRSVQRKVILTIS